MRKLAIVVLIMGGFALAQNEPQVPLTAQVKAANVVEANTTQPSYSDVNCAGFVTPHIYSRENYVTAGWDSPHQMDYADREFVYLAGTGYQEGAVYEVIRPVQDMDREEVFVGQRALMRAAGQLYEEVAHVRVTSLRQVAIAKVEFACSAIYPGDLVVPYEEKTIPTYHAASIQFDPFAPPNGKATGRIFLARDFDFLVGTGTKVYLTVGADQGVKVGDYFRVVRPYNEIHKVHPDNLSLNNMMADPLQKKPPSLPYREWDKLPRRSLGEMIVLNVSPKSSTAMMTYALQDVTVGDAVEMEEPPPPPAPAPAAEAMRPPIISCIATPSTVQEGQSSTINCEASSPDNRPVSISFTSDRGRLAPRDSSAVLDTANAGQGPINVMATASDDRNLTASTTTTVNVEAAPAAPQASKLADIAFRSGSAYVDNRAKAVLDDVALKLQNEPGSTVVISGSAGPRERGASRLPMLRASNARNYLVKSKGVDPNRVKVQTNTSGASAAEIWFVPQGAEMPAAPPQ